MSLRKRINDLFANKPLLAVIAAIMGSSFIALSPLFVRFSEVGSTATAFYRFFFALPLAWTLMIFDNLKSKDHKTPRRVRDYVLLMGAGVFLGLDITLWHLSMIHTSVVNAIMLNSLTPVFVAIAAWLFFKETINFSIILGMLCALLGAAVLVNHKYTGINSDTTGDLYALCSAIFYAAFIICVKDLRKSFASPTVVFWVSLSGMYTLSVNAYFMGEVVVPQSTSGWMLLVGLALVVHILGNGLLSYSMGHLSATFSSLTILVGPFVATLIGWLIFNEKLTVEQLIGGILVIVGIVLSRRKRLSSGKK